MRPAEPTVKKGYLPLLVLVVVFLLAPFRAYASFSQDELSQWFTYYHKYPQPERLAEWLSEELKFGMTLNDTHYYPIAAFCSQVLQDSPQIATDFSRYFSQHTYQDKFLVALILWNSQLPEAEDLVKSALGFTPAELEVLTQFPPYEPLDYDVETPVDMDIMWAIFFATGSEEPINKLIDFVLKPQPVMDKEKSNEQEVYIAQTYLEAAMWSLQANARQFPEIKTQVERRYQQGDEVQKERLSLLLKIM